MSKNEMKLVPKRYLDRELDFLIRDIHDLENELDFGRRAVKQGLIECKMDTLFHLDLIDEAEYECFHMLIKAANFVAEVECDNLMNKVLLEAV